MGNDGKSILATRALGKAVHVLLQQLQQRSRQSRRFYDPQQRTNTGVVQTGSRIMNHGLYNHMEPNRRRDENEINIRLSQPIHVPFPCLFRALITLTGVPSLAPYREVEQPGSLLSLTSLEIVSPTNLDMFTPNLTVIFTFDNSGLTYGRTKDGSANFKLCGPYSTSIVLVRLPIFGNPISQIPNGCDLHSDCGQNHPDGVKNEGVERSPWGSGAECIRSTKPMHP